MKAGEVMHRRVLTATPLASARDVAAKLLGKGISGMPVADREGMVVGVVTEEDILRALMEQRNLTTLTAQDIMSKDLVTVDTETSVEGVMQLLHDEGIMRVPVIDSGRLVGIVSRADVIRSALDVDFKTYGHALAPVSIQRRTAGKKTHKYPKSRSGAPL